MRELHIYKSNRVLTAVVGAGVGVKLNKAASVCDSSRVGEASTRLGAHSAGG